LIALSVFTNVYIPAMHGNDLLDSRLKTQDFYCTHTLLQEADHLVSLCQCLFI